MQRYKAVIEYVGKGYAGMQRQENVKTIQSVIEMALSQFTNGKSTTIDYCGRTDGGVHAFGQVIHFDVDENLPEMKVLMGINFFLYQNSEAVALKSVEKVTQTFHSRFSCIGREYKYYIYNGFIRSPIFEGKMHHVPNVMNIEKMQKASEILVGTHDFSSFRSKSCQALSPIKTVDFIKINKITQDIIEIHISARSFLYHMVRNITGALIYTGIGRIEVDFMREILEKKDITMLPFTAPACGLYFFIAHYQ